MLRNSCIAFTAAMLIAQSAGASDAPATPPPLPPPPRGPTTPPMVSAVPSSSTREVGPPVLATIQKICDYSANASPALKALCDGLRQPRAAVEPTGTYPPGYYSARLGVDICAVAKSVTDQEVSAAAKTTAKDKTKGLSQPEDAGTAMLNLRAACGQAAPRGAALATFGVQLVQGLGDFMVARSKEELVEFAVEVKAKSLCQDSFKQYLIKSCKVLFPDGTDSPPDLESASDGRLQTALRADLNALAGRVLVAVIDAKLPPTVKSPLLDEVLQAIGDGGVDAIRGGDMSRLFDDALGKLPPDDTTTFACQLSDGSSPSTAACIGSLMLEIGSAAVAKRSSDPIAVLEAAADTFCARFGKQPLGTPGQCVFGAPNYSDIQSQAMALISNVNTLYDANIKSGGAQTAIPATANQLSSIEATATALLTAVANLTPHGSAVAVGGILEVAKDLIELATALAAQNSGDALAAAEDLVETINTIEPTLAPDSKAFAFVLAIATAKNRSDVEAAFEAAAAPLGSYRAKYGKGSVANFKITLNGFVGAGIGGQHPLHRVGSVDSWQFYQRLAAPVGLDLNVLGWTLFNIGIGVRVIDPLALTVVTKDGGSADANWASLLDLGGYLRVGLAGSPVNLMVGADYLPGLAPSGGCAAAATGPCWRGAWQLGAALAVDVPLLPLR